MPVLFRHGHFFMIFVSEEVLRGNSNRHRQLSNQFRFLQVYGLLNAKGMQNFYRGSDIFLIELIPFFRLFRDSIF